MPDVEAEPRLAEARPLFPLSVDAYHHNDPCWHLRHPAASEYGAHLGLSSAVSLTQRNASQALLPPD